MSTPYSRLEDALANKEQKDAKRTSLLTLSRKLNETVIVNNEVSIKVTAIEDGKVSLSFEAPHEMPILREEVFLRHVMNMKHDRKS